MIYEELGLFPSEESSQEDSPVRIYQSLVSVLDLPESVQVSFGRSSGSLTISDPSGSSLKTSLVCCQATEDGTWEPSSGRWLSAGMGSPTGFWTLNISESPSDVAECSLSDVLETTGEHLRKYLLSSKACEGILRRATRRGKQLPERLEQALRSVVQ